MKCKGCGILIQYDNPNELGYSPKKNAEYCQRCFRLIHYDDLQISMKTGIPAEEVIKKIEEMDALILWVVDLFDFEASMIAGVNRKFTNKDILLIGTKKDLLPQTVKENKLAQFVFKRLKEYGITIKELMFTSRNDTEGLLDIWDAIKEHANGREIVVMGRANVGKSTLLNRLVNNQIFTTSKYPGTTLDVNILKHKGYTFIDTPGIEIEKNIMLTVDERTLRVIIPEKPIKPKVFQIKGNQSFAIGGLCRVDFMEAQDASVVFYLSNELLIHRGKVENADENWNKHYDELYQPIPLKKEFSRYITGKDEESIDIVIHGLGWVSLHGNIKSAMISVPKGVSITYRKAML